MVALALATLGLSARPAAEGGAPGAVAVVRDAVPVPTAAEPSAAPSTAPAAPGTAPSAERSGTAAAPAPARRPPKRVVVPATGPQTYRKGRAKGTAASRQGRLIRVDVRVERNLRIDADRLGAVVQGILNDRRSWRGTGRWRFQVVPAGRRADLHVYLVTPRTTDRLCAPLLTRGQVSCQNGTAVVLNARRWILGTRAYRGDLQAYRRYLVNHEFGHALGFAHVRCPGRGRKAPVMMQQTKGLGSCRRNPWPAPGRR